MEPLSFGRLLRATAWASYFEPPTLTTRARVQAGPRSLLEAARPSHHATVHDERVPGDVGGRVGGQVDGQGCHLLRRHSRGRPTVLSAHLDEYAGTCTARHRTLSKTSEIDLGLES